MSLLFLNLSPLSASVSAAASAAFMLQACKEGQESGKCFSRINMRCLQQVHRQRHFLSTCAHTMHNAYRPSRDSAQAGLQAASSSSSAAAIYDHVCAMKVERRAEQKEPKGAKDWERLPPLLLLLLLLLLIWLPFGFSSESHFSLFFFFSHSLHWS